jgi:hypothetical protein
MTLIFFKETDQQAAGLPLNSFERNKALYNGKVFNDIRPVRNKKTVLHPARRSPAFNFWVEDGARTHDLRNHNPTF